MNCCGTKKNKDSCEEKKTEEKKDCCSAEKNEDCCEENKGGKVSWIVLAMSITIISVLVLSLII